MLTVTCSSCGTQNVVPDDRPDKITCSGCSKTLSLHYPEQKEAEAGILSKLKTKASNATSATVAFAKRHRKVLAAIGVGLIGAGCTIWKIKQLSEQASQPELPLPDPSSNPDSASDLQPVETNKSDDQDILDNDNYSDWDILSYLSENCENCGASLADGYYTEPWEDDSNEYGYWICPRCGHMNIDWSTVDDDD